MKEQYFYLDATPTYSYAKALYKYPQTAFPYVWLEEENERRGKRDPEFELVDTGVFNENRYFDVFAEYAKASPNDILIRITVANRGPEAATLHLLPITWFRNRWSWGTHGRRRNYEAVYYTGRKLPFAQPSDARPLLSASRVRFAWPTSETAFH